MRRTVLAAVAFSIFAGLAGCAEVASYGAAAIEQRRIMNDLQARATLLGLCDLSYGSVQRLTPDSRRAVEIACGAEDLPERLEAPGP